MALFTLHIFCQFFFQKYSSLHKRRIHEKRCSHIVILLIDELDIFGIENVIWQSLWQSCNKKCVFLVYTKPFQYNSTYLYVSKIAKRQIMEVRKKSCCSNICPPSVWNRVKDFHWAFLYFISTEDGRFHWMKMKWEICLRYYSETDSFSVL